MRADGTIGRFRPPDGLDVTRLRDQWKAYQREWKAGGPAYVLASTQRPDLGFCRKTALWIPCLPDSPPLPDSAVDPTCLVGNEAAKAAVVDDLRADLVKQYIEWLDDVGADAARYADAALSAMERGCDADIVGQDLKKVIDIVLSKLARLADSILTEQPLMAATTTEDAGDALSASLQPTPVVRGTNAIDAHNVRSGRVAEVSRLGKAETSLGGAIDVYLADVRGRIGRKVDGLSESRAIEIRDRLLQSVGLGRGTGDVVDANARKPLVSGGHEVEVPGVNLDSSLHDVGRQAIANIANYWYGDSDLSPKTASNRIAELKDFIEWAADEGDYRYSLPSNINKKLKTTNVTHVVPDYDPVRLRSWLDAADETWRCYLLLALNCGYRQADLAELQFAHLVEDDNGHPSLSKIRGKSRHQNKKKWKSSHTLWREAVAALEACPAYRRARDAGSEMMFLNEAGKPLNPHTVGKRYAEVLRPRVNGDDLLLKDWRGIGSSLVRAESKSIVVQSAYLADLSGAPGVLPSYTAAMLTETLSPSLAALRSRLIADDVLDVCS